MKNAITLVEEEQKTGTLASLKFLQNMLRAIIQEMNRTKDIAKEFPTSLNTIQKSLMKYFAQDVEDAQEAVLF